MIFTEEQCDLILSRLRYIARPTCGLPAERRDDICEFIRTDATAQNTRAALVTCVWMAQELLEELGALP